MVYLQKAVDGFRLPARQLGKPLGRAPRGGGQGHAVPVFFKGGQHAVHRRRLAGARPAGEHQRVLAQRFFNGLFLQRRIADAVHGLQPADGRGRAFAAVRRKAHGLAQGQRHAPLGVIVFRQVYGRILFLAKQHGVAVIAHLAQGAFHLLRLHMQKLRHRGHQLCRGQAGVAVVQIMAQHMHKARAHALERIVFQAQLPGNGVCRAKILISGVAAQKVRVVAQHVHGIRPIVAVQRHGNAGRKLPARQALDGLAHAKHFLKLARGLVRLFARKALHRGQHLGLAGNHLQRFLAKGGHNARGNGLANMRQSAAREVAPDGGGRLGQAHFIAFCFKLLAEGGVHGKAPVQRNLFARAHLAQRAHGGVQLAVALVRHLQHGIARLLVGIYHRLHRAGDA